MFIFILFLLFLSCFFIGNSDNINLDTNEDIKIHLLSESNPTDDEIIKYCLELYNQNNHKSEVNTYLEYFYGSNKNMNQIGMMYYGNLVVGYDEALSCNTYDFTFNAPNQLTFKKGYIYVVNSFIDGSTRGIRGIPVISNFLSTVYGVNIADYFNIHTLTCDTFGDGDFEYEEYQLYQQNILRKMNQDVVSVFDPSTIDEESTYLFPKADCTFTKLANPDYSSLYHPLSWTQNDDTKRKYYNYDDFGFKIYENSPKEGSYFIKFNNPTFLLDADHLVSFDTILAQITATDQTDGDITDKIVVEENTYLPVNNKLYPGPYYFTVSVEDSHGNSATKTFNVNVYDNTPPTVSVNDITISYKDSITQADILNSLTVSDNCDTKENLTKTIINDTYTNASSYKTFNAACNSYPITVIVTDKSGNQTTKKLNVNIIDNIAPTLSVLSPVISYTTSPLSINDIKSKVTAVDEYDGTLAITLTNNDSYGSKNEIKMYSFTASATDQAGNSSSIDFNVSLVDNDIPEINYSTQYLIVVDENQSLTNQNILDMLKNDVDLTNFKVTIIESEYLSNNKGVGNYDVVIKGVDLFTTEEKVIHAEIRVTENKAKEVIKEETLVKSNLELFYENNKLFIIVMASIISLSFIILIILLIKNLRKNKNNI